MIFLYRLLTALTYPFYRYGLLPYRLRKQKEDPLRYKEKLGFPSRSKKDQKLVWLHAASVGESLSLLKLIERLVKEHPAWQILITSGTVTSAQMIQDRFPRTIIHQYAPLDFVCSLNRFLNHWQPDLMIWVESELWPNLIQKAAAKRIPLVLLNMRLSPKSFDRWVMFKKTFFKLLNAFHLILTQTQELHHNLQHIGYKKSLFCGNLKYAADISSFQQEALLPLQTALKNRRHWMAASTHHPEEEIILTTHKKLLTHHKTACLILVIRHPHRCHDIEKLIKTHNLTYKRYSHWKNNPAPLTEDILLVDQMGVMGLLYDLSTYVVIGGSLVNHIGGHNVLEPLRQQCVTLHGPYMANFKEIIVATKQAHVTHEIKNASEITQTLLDFMDNPEKTQKALKKSTDFLTHHTKVLGHILNQLEPYLQNEVPCERT